MDHPLRDLARQIETLAKDHPAYCQAQPAVQNLIDHLCAMARCHEANEKIVSLTDAVERMERVDDARVTELDE